MNRVNSDWGKMKTQYDERGREGGVEVSTRQASIQLSLHGIRWHTAYQNVQYVC